MSVVKQGTVMLPPTQPSPKEHNRLALLWDQHAKQFKPYQRYKKVAVLMISWEDTDMDTSEEVSKLANVFREYKFEVIPFAFKRETVAQSQLNRAVANFTDDHADPRTLLIVYYAGHGQAFKQPGDQPGYIMAGRPCKNPRKVGSINSALWSDAEGLLKTVSDALLIFDSCYAGILCHSRDAEDSKLEYLTSCSATQRCPVPGDNSFTSALIKALSDLKDGEPFTTTELCAKTTEHYETDDPGPIPMVRDPRKQGPNVPIMICPMDRGFDEATTEKKEGLLQYIDARFIISQEVDDEKVAELSKLLNSWVEEQYPNLPIETTRFLGKNPTRFPVEMARSVIEHWTHVVQFKKLSRETRKKQQEVGSSVEEVEKAESSNREKKQNRSPKSSRKRTSITQEATPSTEDDTDSGERSTPDSGFHMNLRKRPRL